MSEQNNPSDVTGRTSLFDLRLIIALLFGIYGVVLTIVGIGFTTTADLAKAGGVNVNLWSGLVMLLFAGVFVVWVRLRPLQVPVPADADHNRTKVS